ncbi:transmembrane 9 superfamily member 9-like protein [Tanacetum coccineum]
MNLTETQQLNILHSMGQATHVYDFQHGEAVNKHVENKYGFYESAYGEGVKAYTQLATKMALSQNISVPWITCQPIGCSRSSSLGISSLLFKLQSAPLAAYYKLLLNRVKLTYVESVDDETYDQVLESVLVGPIHVGNYHFFFEGDNLRVKVIKLASTKTQLPYAYYFIPYYHLNETIDNAIGNAENPGEVPCGDHTKKSPYEFQMRVPQMCNVVCHIVLTEKTANEFKEKIDDEYRVNMIFDNLPLVVIMASLERDSPAKKAKYFINNHLTFIVKYHKDIRTDYARIVGFEVNAFRIGLVVRYHEVKDEGYEIDQDSKLIDVFSALNYCDQVTLKAKINNTLTFLKTKHSN